MAKDDPARVKKKPRNKGDFHGLREEFLLSQLEPYLAASKAKKTRKFYQGLFPQYWMKFHWSLPLKDDPSPTDVYPAEDAWTPAQETAKAETQAAMKQHPDFKDGVSQVFEARRASILKEQQLARHCDVARELLVKELEEVKARIRNKAKQSHEEELGRWEEADEGFPAMDPEGQAEARVRFTSVVSPLLQALQSYTGFHITLIAGRIDGGKFELCSLHAGKTKSGNDEDGGLDFTEWDGAGYKDHVLNQFMCYLIAADQEASEKDTDSDLKTRTPDLAAPVAPLEPQSPLAAPVAPLDPQSLSRSNLTTPIAPLDQPPRIPVVPPAPTSSIPDVFADTAPPRAHPRMLEETLDDRFHMLAIAEPDLSAGAGSPPVPNPATKAASRKQGRAPLGAKARKRTQTGRTSCKDDETSDEDSGGGKSDLDGDDNDDQRAEPAQTRVRGGKSSPGVVPDVLEGGDEGDGEGDDAGEARVPKWAKSARATLLSAGPDSTGQNPLWKKGVELWWNLKRLTHFVSPIKGLGTTKRPEEIHTWIKCARATTPKLKNVDGFMEEWREWWRTLNPGWRSMGDKVGEGLIRDPEASVEVLRKPGVNGFLSVLIRLKWWMDAKGATKDWIAALDDITWVMGRLLRCAHPAILEVNIGCYGRYRIGGV
ncbi:hypothetical protein K438DRAFT_1775748 [Mycena galopus ATCC 62051]|nr:hypothetical protein K438DRAFT_1775748 [Mycena galopus ATCC 62051]